MNVYLGFDPGQHGAMGVIFCDVIEVHDFDDGSALLRLMELHANQNLKLHAVIEKVHSMPKQGVKGVFNFGMNYGILQGWLQALKIPYDLVTPQKWQKVMLDSAKKGKDENRLRAIRIFPTMLPKLQRKKDHDRADALMMAEYCNLMNNGAKRGKPTAGNKTFPIG